MKKSTCRCAILRRSPVSRFKTAARAPTPAESAEPRRNKSVSSSDTFEKIVTQFFTITEFGFMHIKIYHL